MIGTSPRFPAERLVAGAVLSLLLASPSLSSAQPPSGELRVIVFSGGQPKADVSVSTGGLELTTGTDGSVVFSLREGPHFVTIAPNAQPRSSTYPIAIISGEEVEVVITLAASGVIARVDVESAEARAAARAVENEFADKLANAPKGTLGGAVIGPNSEPVAGARVFVRGTPLESVTDETGSFELTLPAGAYDLTVIHPQYTTANQTGVRVVASEATAIDVRVETATPQLDDFVVSAPHIEGGVASLIAERRESNSVADVIGAEEMSRSGDSDAAGALKRVTGITVVGGRFVYVRGMGERYSSTLLNGQGIPSPEPERRVIPLDLFSTDVLDSVLIQKTPSPDLPGEFGGGVVKLRTKGFPEKLTASVSLSTGLVTNATFRDRPTHEGGGLDFLGVDDGTRELPDEIREQSPLREGNLFEEGLTPEELAELGRLLPASYNIKSEATPLNRSIAATIGDKHEVLARPAGYFLTGSYGDDYSYSSQEYKRFVASDAAEGGLELNNDFRIRELARAISASGMLALGAELAAGHSVRATTLLLRITENETAEVTGRSDDLGRDIRRSRLRFAEQQLISQQLVGEHQITALGGGKLEWRYAASQASRDEPDRREYFYVDESADPDDGKPDFQISGRPAGNQRVWNELVDRMHDAAIDYTHPIALGRDPERTLEIKGGASVVFRNRDFNALRLTLRAPRMLSADDRRLDPESIWSPDNINAADGWILEDTTQPTDAYTAEQQIQAGYLMVTYPATPTIEVMAGLRVERSRQEVTTFAPFSVDEIPLEAILENTDPLPSATLRWALSDETVLRIGYGRTVSRPDFRELSESQYRDVVTATRFVGNPELKRGTINNFDARFEVYFSTDESASVGAFYKTFDSPIEQVDLGGVDRSVSWDNAEGATNIGIELEGRKQFGFVHPRLESAFAALNVAFIRSQVTLGEEGQAASTSAERALQGQSPFVINAQVGYDGAAEGGTSAALLLNVFGKRIRDVGRLGTPDIFESPFAALDVVVSQKLPHNLSLKLKAKNLLDRELTFRQGDKVVRRSRLGRVFSISLGWAR